MMGCTHGLVGFWRGGRAPDDGRLAANGAPVYGQNRNGKRRARGGTAAGAHRFCGEGGGQPSGCVQRICPGALRLLAACSSPV